MKKKKAKNKIGRPFAPLYIGAALFLYPIYKIKYGLKIDKTGIKGIKGPALVLSQHLSGKDHVLCGLTLFPKRPTFVASEHFLLNPTLKKLFKWLHVITKRMFCSDVTTIIKMMRAKEEKNIIVLFPEGRLPANGVSVPVTEGTALLVEKLGIDVYFMRASGAYHTFPKWSKEEHKGNINITTKKILSAEQIKGMSRDEIDSVLQKEFVYNEDKSLIGDTYKCSKSAEGLENLLWKCPKCKRDWTLTTENNHVKCDCGFDVVLKENYEFDSGDFKTINDWYEWQSDCLVKEKSSLSCEARLGTPGPDGKLISDAGRAYVTIDKEKFNLDGDLLGDNISMEMSLEKLAGFPITVGEHFDVYYKGQMIYVYPEPEDKTAIEWVAYLDAMLRK